MKCAKCKELLDAYARSLLDSGDTEAVESHFKNCPECAAILDSLRDFLVVMDNEPEEIIPKDELADFLPEMWQKIESAKPRKTRHWRLAPIIAGSIILAVLVLRPVTNIQLPKSENMTAQDTNDVYYDNMYTEDAFQGLVKAMFSSSDFDEIEAIENELVSHKGMLTNDYIESDFDNLTDEGLQTFERKLEELRSKTG